MFRNYKKYRRYVYARDGNRCLRCRSAENLTLDHIVPVSKGGSDLPFNLQTLCERCNHRKDADTIDYTEQEVKLESIQRRIAELKAKQ